MADYKLTSPKLLVIRGSLDEPELIEVQTLHPDLTAWDTTRRKHGWGGAQDEPFRWLGFISWHAAKRTGAITTDLTYEAWDASLIEVQTLTAEPVDPTRLAPEPDSSAS